MGIEFKKIDFENTLSFFLRGRGKYETRNCHMNTYSTFYDVSYNEVLRDEKSFSYSTGLMLYDGDKKYCVIHSWVEYKGKVVDLTSFANSQLKFVAKPTMYLINSIRKLLKEKVQYVAHSNISNKDLNSTLQKIAQKCQNDMLKIKFEIENYLNSIVDDVKNDETFLKTITEKYGYELKEDSFQIEIK